MKSMKIVYDTQRGKAVSDKLIQKRKLFEVDITVV